MKQAIPVTRKNIECPGANCPVAAALKLEYPLACTGWTNLWLDRADRTNQFYRLSQEVSAWIRRFDLIGASAVEPFVLVLDHSKGTAEMLKGGR